MRADLVTQAIEAGKHIYCEKPVADQLDKAVALAKLAETAGHQARRGAGQAVPARPAQDQDAARGRLLRPHLRGARRVRLLGVRGRLGPAGAAAELELQESRRRRHHPRHAVPLALRARQPVRRRAGGELPRRDAHPEPRRRERQDLSGRHRRCRLRDLPARGRRGRAHQLLVGDAVAARRPRDVPGRRHARLGGRRADALRDAVAREHAAPGVESRTCRRP